jgi:hypothetical protein
MKRFTANFRKVHLVIFLGFNLVFSTLTLWAMVHQSPSDWRENQNFTATALAVSGPFTGAIARPTQTDCRQFGWKLLPYCAAGLLWAVGWQCVPLPFQRGANAFRLIMWGLGLAGWFAGTVLSLMFALS